MGMHQKRNARVTINAVHPGVVKTGIIRDHKGLVTGIIFLIMCHNVCLLGRIFHVFQYNHIGCRRSTMLLITVGHVYILITIINFDFLQFFMQIPCFS